MLVRSRTTEKTSVVLEESCPFSKAA